MNGDSIFLFRAPSTHAPNNSLTSSKDVITLNGIMKDMHHKLSNSLRLLAALACIIILVARAPYIEKLGHTLLYAASWITFIHICFGVYVFTRFLRAYSHTQQVLDVIAASLLTVCLFFFTRPAIWAACLAAFTAIAIIKYIFLYTRRKDAILRRYIRSKILLETPAAILVGLAAGIFAFGDLPNWLTLGLQTTLLAGTSLFAAWMIFIRRAYHKSNLLATDDA